MTGPSVVSIGRIEPDLARESWDRTTRLVARDDPLASSDDLRCVIAVFGHGDGLAEAIARVRRVLAAGTAPHLQRHVVVLADVSKEPEADTPGTLYMTWLFKPDTPDEQVEEIYMHTLTLAFFAAIQRTPRARVIWPSDDEIAARVMTAAVPPQGDVQ